MKQNNRTWFSWCIIRRIIKLIQVSRYIFKEGIRVRQSNSVLSLLSNYSLKNTTDIFPWFGYSKIQVFQKFPLHGWTELQNHFFTFSRFDVNSFGRTRHHASEIHGLVTVCNGSWYISLWENMFPSKIINNLNLIRNRRRKWNFNTLWKKTSIKLEKRYSHIIISAESDNSWHQTIDINNNYK